ncbi:O-antigen ligase family protein [Blastococcus sp. SYSU D00669]
MLPSHWLLVSALGLALVEPTVQELLGAPTSVTKALVIALAGVAVLRCGLARLGPPALAFMALWVFALGWSLLSPDPYRLGIVGMVTAWLGFLSGWVFLLPRISPSSRAVVLKALAFGPLLIGGLGFLIWPVTGRSPLSLDETGVLRLQGLSIAPHLAMAAFVAAAASLYGMKVGVIRRGYLWALVNAAIASATLSRGAIAAIAVLLLFGVVLRAAPAHRRGAKAVAVIALGAIGVAATVGAVQRNAGNSYEGSFNTSGRLQAWQFFLAVAERHPFAGNGLGASSVANAAESPVGVQPAFIAPHNEYIHLFVDVGWLFAALLMGSVAWLVISAFWRAMGWQVVVGILGGLAVLASVDNPLSTPSIPLMLALLLNLVGEWNEEGHVRAPGRLRVEGAHHRVASRAQRLAPH